MTKHQRYENSPYRTDSTESEDGSSARDNTQVEAPGINPYTGTFNKLFVLEDFMDVKTIRPGKLITLQGAFDGSMNEEDLVETWDLALMQDFDREEKYLPARIQTYDIPFIREESFADSFAEAIKMYLGNGFERFLIGTPNRELPTLYEINPTGTNRLVSKGFNTTTLEQIKSFVTEKESERITKAIKELRY
ncbi:hypothetical protein CMI45_02795 [Candidatus Pacearchaeota archaeon]|nr:hypothetical protein [Candidatus Pacearchaeota archaeon]|tara:strand:- start:2025 stop:2600 length:576 start_codon:yes stop_codon:yes gene_type:complete